MDAIGAYNSDSDNDIGDETNYAADGIKILEGSSVSLNPTDFFGLGEGEDSDEPPSKKIKADDEEKNNVAIVQGNAVEIPNTDFWNDITHKQIVVINNAETPLGSSLLIMKPEQTSVSKTSSNTLLASSSLNSRASSILKTTKKKSSLTTNKSIRSVTTTSCAATLPTTVQFVSLFQPSSGGLPVLNIVPSTQTNAPFVLSTTAVPAFGSETMGILTLPLHSVLNSVSSAQTELTDRPSTAASLMPSPSTTQVTNSDAMPTQVMSNILTNDGSEKMPQIKTFLLPARGDQPAKLIQLFPTKSIIDQNLVGQNVSDLPTCISQTVQNPVVIGDLNQVLSSRVQAKPSLIPLIKLMPATQHSNVTVPLTGHSMHLTETVSKLKPQCQILAAEKLKCLASQISEQKLKSSAPNKSELLRLLQSPRVTSPASLRSSILMQKSPETNSTIYSPSTLAPDSNRSPQPRVSKNGSENVSSGVIKDKPLTERINNLLSGHYVARKEQLFQVSDKILCLFNKSIFNKTKPPTRIERSFLAHKSIVNRIKWNCPQYSHLLLSVSMDGTMKVFNALGHADTNMLLQVITDHSKAIKDAEWSSDGHTILSCSYDKSALVTDVGTGKRICKLLHDSFVSCGKFNPLFEKNVVTGSKNILQAWDIRTPEKPVRVFKYKDKMGQVQDVLFCATGHELFSASGTVSRDSADRNIMAWDYGSGAILSNQIFKECYSCTRLKLHPNKDTFLSQTQGGYIAIFSTRQPYVMTWSKRYEGHKMEGYDVGFDVSADGNVVVSGSADGILYCYSTFTGKLWRTMSTGFDVCLDAAFHPVLPSTVACCSTKGQIKIFH